MQDVLTQPLSGMMTTAAAQTDAMMPRHVCREHNTSPEAVSVAVNTWVTAPTPQLRETRMQGAPVYLDVVMSRRAPLVSGLMKHAAVSVS